ncbi:MAG: CoB--CoM heterodisulfide reductase iron-sulfur subunit B family protein [Desulfosarcinaceae bacterium]|nr:CoB--CoM heterodisulfide reductase iron-sulfur subunit B family protein [Desulfosarcinaceae bacterium]
MKSAYLYYPGCTLETTAVEYHRATRALFGRLEVDLVEIDDWTCCGASAAEASSPLLALCLAARNLALAEAQASSSDILVPCSACYLNLRRVAVNTAQLQRVNTVLAKEQLQLAAPPAVRHLLDILSRDVGAARIADQIGRPLDGLKVAAYYGCQCLRPYPVFDDPERPTSMASLIQATGAEVFPWEMGARCCGAAHLTTKRSVGLKLVAEILVAARGADLVTTVCPMCQLNLEAYQGAVSRAVGQDLAIPVLYLPQLLGLAMGLDGEAVGLPLNLALSEALMMRLNGAVAG